MKIRLDKNTLTIQLTDEEKERLLKEGLKALIEKPKTENGTIHWSPHTPQYWAYPPKKDDDVFDVSPKIMLTEEKYPCEAGWPWRDKDGHMLGGAQVTNDFPCEASGLLKNRKA